MRIHRRSTKKEIIRETTKGVLALILTMITLAITAWLMTSCVEITSVDLPKWQDYTCVPVDSTDGWRCAYTEAP